jgi:insulysin
VHLIAQAKPKEPTDEERKTQALTVFTTILEEEKISTSATTLKSRIDGLSTAVDTDNALVNAISAHLTEDLKLEKEKVDKVLDEAKAALGLAEGDSKLENPQPLTNGDVQKVSDPTKPVLITDVHAWKAGLLLSTGVRPVKDLGEFVEGSAKL